MSDRWCRGAGGACAAAFAAETCWIAFLVWMACRP
jgi:hypothetical protein